jgi:hypothetical protein
MRTALYRFLLLLRFGDEEHPEELREVLNDGIKAVNRLFE